MSLRMLPEWAAPERVWIGFPSDPVAWGQPLAEAQRQIAAFANAVHDGGRGETVHLIAKGTEATARARDLCDDGVVVEDRLIGDIWLRDTGCIIVGSGASRVARNFGATGIGLCRTEPMFFEGERIRAVREMILADDEAGRRRALTKLLPIQRSDFEGLFRAMNGLPVTIRLLDPPLHEFVPHDDANQKIMAAEMKVPLGKIKMRVEELHEFNPMMGHRGCRLGISYPEITEMQARAMIEAALNVRSEGIAVKAEIMVPLVGTVREFNAQAKVIRTTADKVFAERGEKIDYLLGTMIETPRAAVIADSIGKQAEFFSFGTNDLTQMTLGFSRDDAGKFLPDYVKRGIYERDPFRSIDQKGVGALVQMAVEKGRSVRPDIEVGVCGEHGGDPASIEFFHRAGLDYVSCSPFRVPIARLAAAQAAIAA